MAAPIENSIALDYLIQESRDVAARVSTHLIAMEQTAVVSFGAIFLAAGIVVGKGKPWFLMLLPIVAALFVSHAFDLLGEVYALGGYRAALEEQITERSGGTPLHVWESVVSPAVRHVESPRVSPGSVYWFTIGICIAAVDVAALVEAFNTKTAGGALGAHHWWAVAVTTATVAYGAAAIALGARGVLGQGEAARELAAEALQRQDMGTAP